MVSSSPQASGEALRSQQSLGGAAEEEEEEEEVQGGNAFLSLRVGGGGVNK